MKRIFPLILTFLIVISVGSTSAAAKEMLDRIVAVVNDEVITQSELDRQLAPVYQSFKEQYKGAEFFTQMSKARVQILNQMVEDKLVLQEARKKNIQISKQDVDRKLAEFKERFKSVNDFQRFLDSQGVTLNKMKERYRDMLMIQRMHQIAVRSRVVVSPLEAKRYYEEHPDEFMTPKGYLMRSITIRKADDKRGALRNKLENLRKKIVNNEVEFEDAAVEHSEDTHADEGGNMDYISEGEFIPHLEEAMFKLNPGEVTPVLESEIGYHIFKMEDVREAEAPAFEDVKKKIEGMLYYQKSKKRFSEWVTQLREDAYISIR